MFLQYQLGEVDQEELRDALASFLQVIENSEDQVVNHSNLQCGWKGMRVGWGVAPRETLSVSCSPLWYFTIASPDRAVRVCASSLCWCKQE